MNKTSKKEQRNQVFSVFFVCERVPIGTDLIGTLFLVGSAKQVRPYWHWHTFLKFPLDKWSINDRLYAESTNNRPKEEK